VVDVYILASSFDISTIIASPMTLTKPLHTFIIPYARTACQKDEAIIESPSQARVYKIENKIKYDFRLVPQR
tara:strand:+ start:226 stop:441 length:216 start_codon:yes stop_codon:yes gene_type:complete